MRREPDYFGEQDLDLIYIAKCLKEAQHLEELLTQAGVEYLVEPDQYSGGIIFRTQRVGAFFYVAPESIGAARQGMAAAGLTPYATE